MRRIPSALAACAVIVSTLVIAACGATANPNAATVNGQPVTVDSVNELARDGVFVRSVLGAATATDPSVLDGSTARSALLFLMQKEALRTEVARWGLKVTPNDQSTAEGELQQVLSNSNAPDASTLSASTRDTLIDFLALGSVVDRRLSKLSPDSPDDLDLLYRGAPALWRRACVTGVQVDPAVTADAERLAAQRVRLEAWERRSKGIAVVATTKQACLPVDRLPGPLRVAVDRARTGVTVGPVVVTDSQARAIYWFRVDRRVVVSRKAATKDLQALAANLVRNGAASWLGLRLLSNVWVNPQYGSGVEIGSQGRLVVSPPEAPASTVPTSEPLGAGSSDPAGAPSGR
ncbi:MAG: hypothetical protein ACKOYM_08010 [Actinomycetes bacterium]